jgi:hypothetical protein
MATTEKRIAALETKQANTDMAGMTAAELDAHLGALEAGTPEWFRVMLTGIWRRGSKLPISTAR